MKQFELCNVKDPEYFRDGRLDAHSDHVYYASEEEAVDRETVLPRVSEWTLEIPVCEKL